MKLSPFQSSAYLDIPGFDFVFSMQGICEFCLCSPSLHRGLEIPLQQDAGAVLELTLFASLLSEITVLQCLMFGVLKILLRIFIYFLFVSVERVPLLWLSGSGIPNPVQF